MARSLTIFIDALPFEQLDNMPYTRKLASRARLVPILGYSVNCQTQLFTGQTPDEIGYWCEWQYDPKNSPFRRLRWILRALAPLERFYYVKRVIHKVLDRLGWVSSTKNIPLRLLADFKETGHSIFNRKFFKHPSLLDDPKLNCFLHTSFPVAEQRDEDAFQATLAHIGSNEDPGSLLVTFTRIDAISHHKGVGSPAFFEMLAKNDDYIRRLSEAFLEKAPDGTVFVVSDHGMTNIEHPVRLELEDRFGPPGPGRYAYFTEGTITRVWCADLDLRGRIKDYLDNLEGIEFFDDAERQRDGITRAEFGDLIYHSLETYQFIPSFWGPKPSVGMHGHHPRYPRQHGVCLSSRAGDFEGEVRAGDFYRVLADQLAS